LVEDVDAGVVFRVAAVCSDEAGSDGFNGDFVEPGGRAQTEDEVDCA
jgi:hypothetical protein